GDNRWDHPTWCRWARKDPIKIPRIPMFPRWDATCGCASAYAPSQSLVTTALQWRPCSTQPVPYSEGLPELPVTVIMLTATLIHTIHRRWILRTHQHRWMSGSAILAIEHARMR